MEKFELAFSDDVLTCVDDKYFQVDWIDLANELRRAKTHIEKLEAELDEYKRQYEAACVTIDEMDELKGEADEIIESFSKGNICAVVGMRMGKEFLAKLVNKSHAYLKASREFNL